MTIYLIYGAILVATCIIFIIIKDKIKAIKLIGVLTILSSLLLMVLMFILRLIINSSITKINISSITDYLLMKFIYTSIILFLIGLSEIIISKYIYIIKKA